MGANKKITCGACAVLPIPSIVKYLGGAAHLLKYTASSPFREIKKKKEADIIFELVNEKIKEDGPTECEVFIEGKNYLVDIKKKKAYKLRVSDEKRINKLIMEEHPPPATTKENIAEDEGWVLGAFGWTCKECSISAPDMGDPTMFCNIDADDFEQSKEEIEVEKAKV